MLWRKRVRLHFAAMSYSYSAPNSAEPYTVRMSRLLDAKYQLQLKMLETLLANVDRMQVPQATAHYLCEPARSPSTLRTAMVPLQSTSGPALHHNAHRQKRRYMDFPTTQQTRQAHARPEKCRPLMTTLWPELRKRHSPEALARI
jgi:hypothetical protein